MSKQNTGDEAAHTAVAVSPLTVMQFGLGLVSARAGVSPGAAIFFGLAFELLRERGDLVGRAAAMRDLMVYVTGYGVGAATNWVGEAEAYKRLSRKPK